jgi:L-asparaginase
VTSTFLAMQHKIINIHTAAPQHSETSLLIIYTGGTIGMVYDETGQHLIPMDFGRIDQKIPELQRFKMHLTVLSLLEPFDSSDVSLSHWKLLAQIIEEYYHAYDGFVILHGTDTMAYTASALSFMLENLHKPVIFTGALVPIGRARTDARRNLITALQIASAKENNKAMVQEVCIYFDRVLLRGNRAKKVENRHFDSFKSGNYPALAEAGLDIDYNRLHLWRPAGEELIVHPNLDDRVVLLKLFPGLTPKVVETVFTSEGLRGIVLETFGSGNAPTQPWFLDCLRRAVDKGIIVLNVSQCNEGKVDQGIYQTSKFMKEIGVVGGTDITPEAGITKLMYVLGLNLPLEEAKELLSQNLRGEITRWSRKNKYLMRP